MNIIHIRYNQLNKIKDEYVAAIGNFDGVHSGHRKVIERAKKLAVKHQMKLGVLSFDITPRQLVNNIDNYYVLKSPEQKNNILKSLGVDTLFLIHFNNEIKNMSPMDFIENVINDNNIKYLVCGYDWRFGKDKAGDVELLKQQSSFETVVLDKVEYDNQKVGSTAIHEYLSHGQVTKANKLLKKEYSIVGKVIQGNQKGRMIGFPTANIRPIVNYRIPQTGVYASKVIYEGKEYYSMTNIGHNPTFNFSQTASIETNIFDFDEDIYGKEIEVIFYKHIRREKIFDGVDELVMQLKKDKQEIVNYFNEK